MKVYDVIIVGGGAAGFFVAANLLSKSQNFKILLLEKSKQVLQKVKISGGGRCNVTHACFEPKELIQFYPRGNQELLGPFYRFQPADTIQWFESKQVPLKIEKDKRIFPKSNNSQSIIDCLLKYSQNIDLHLSEALIDFQNQNSLYQVTTNKNLYQTRNLVLTTGSSKEIWNLLTSKKIAIVDPVPSLFTFKFVNPWSHLSGISVKQVCLKIKDLPIQSCGDFLITHQGCSGPVTLALSAWAARVLYYRNYRFDLIIDWTHQSLDWEQLNGFIQNHHFKELHNACPVDIPNRLWKFLLYDYAQFHSKKWGQLKENEKNKIFEILTHTVVPINGKNTFKEEFVTAGGVDLKSINFKTMEHKLYSNLYFAGEILNIDAVTGGFNFQAAWTTGFIVAESILKK